MHPADIIAALKKAGQPPAQVALDLRRSKSLVSMVINGQATSGYVADRIAEILKKPKEQIWPLKYGTRRAG